MRGLVEQNIDFDLTDESLEELQIRFEMPKRTIRIFEHIRLFH